GAFPSLPGDRVRGLHEDEREITPEPGADEQVELSLAQVEGGALGAQRAQARGQEADREHADEAVEEPDDFPEPVPLDDVHLPLRDAAERVQLCVPYPDSDAHVPSSFSSASAKLLPVRCMKTSSSVGSDLPFACTRQ